MVRVDELGGLLQKNMRCRKANRTDRAKRGAGLRRGLLRLPVISTPMTFGNR